HPRFFGGYLRAQSASRPRGGGTPPSKSRRLTGAAGFFDFAEELDRGLDAVVERLDDERDDARVLAPHHFVITLPLDRMDDDRRIAVAQEQEIHEQASHLP